MPPYLTGIAGGLIWRHIAAAYKQGAKKPKGSSCLLVWAFLFGGKGMHEGAYYDGVWTERGD
jgi:hypothetical protein